MDDIRERPRPGDAGAQPPRDMSVLSGETKSNKSEAGQAGAAIAERARDFAEQQKEAGADNVARLGHAVHGAADQLGRELPQAAGYIHSAADNLQTAASALRERSIEDILSDFTGFARRQPAAAFTGAVLAGFALSRFLKSSSPNDQR